MKGTKASISPLLFGIISCWIWQCSCIGKQENLYAAANLTGKASKTPASSYNALMIDSAIKQLRTGDMVLRTGSDVTSYMLAQMNEKDKTFSHCGFVRIENGYPFVYHAIGGEDNPDEVLRRDSAKQWFSPASNLGLGIARFDLDSSQARALSSIILQYYQEKRKFDMDFDLGTDQRLYCAELIYKAVSYATADPSFFRLVNAFGRTYINVENLYQNPHTKLIWQVRYK